MRVINRKQPEPGQKTACIVRYGAWGDAVLIPPVIKALKADGYHVTLNCTEACFSILKHDPNIDRIWLQKTDEVKAADLLPHYEKLSKFFDRFVQLNGSVEMSLVKVPSQPEYSLPHAQRHALCDKNHQDYTMEVAGYPDKKGEVSELHFKPTEEQWAKDHFEKRPGYNIVWCLSGSSIHKIYPYADSVIQAILEGIPESHITLVGEAGCYGIIDPHPRITDACGKFGIRKSFVLTKYADLVVATETGIASAAGCFETPKVVILSSSSVENLTKYWKNCISVFQKVSCYPCHQLHYTRDSCPLDEINRLPLCQVTLHPGKVAQAVEQHYMAWQKKNLEKV